jgi:hypothetical protein
MMTVLELPYVHPKAYDIILGRWPLQFYSYVKSTILA